MAWRSSGNDNDDMVNNLTGYGVITTPAVEAAFRNVDRIHFVPQSHRGLAHSDQPLKDDNIHISAPHIYGTIVEALDLQPGVAHSFLNIGSGTGYLSSIVSQVLGKDAYMFGVELFPDVVKHCTESIQRWTDARNISCEDYTFVEPSMDFVCGNGLEIDPDNGESLFGFDRIYVGASVGPEHLTKVANLLRPGGILVAPVEDDLIKVTRLGMTSPTAVDDAAKSGRSNRSLLCRSTPASTTLSDDFTQQVISGVRFAPLLRTPSKTTIIPSKVWDPSIHNKYPTTFKHAIKEILLCSQAEPIQPIRIVKSENVNLAATLPKDIWMKVLSFTHRSWFDQPYKVNESFLQQRIVQEQQAAQEAKDACADAERRLRTMERERDVYKLLAMRWQLRLRTVMKETKKSKAKGVSYRSSNISGDEDPLFSMDASTQAAAVFFTAENILANSSYDSDATSDIEGDNAEGENEGDEGSDLEENDLNNMESESDDDASDDNEMIDDDSDEDDSEDVTLAASPDTTEGSFFRQMSASIQDQSFFT